jgi:hypothetical protein
MEIDSSRAGKKWSRHLTIKIPGHAFASYADVKRLVKNHVLHHEWASVLTLSSDPSKSVVDEGVYTPCATSQMMMMSNDCCMAIVTCFFPAFPALSSAVYQFLDVCM